MKLTTKLSEDSDGYNIVKVYNDNDELVAEWYDCAAVDWPEDLTYDRTIGSLIRECYEKGYKDASKKADEVIKTLQFKVKFLEEKCAVS